MDLQRLFLFLIFSVSSMLVWENWQRAQHPAPAPVTAASGVPAATTSLTAAPSGSAPATVATEVKRISGAKIVVKTDNFVAEINTVGGDLRRLELAQHRDAKDKAKLFVLMQEQGTHSYLAQTGLLGAGLPTHNSLFSSAASEYQMAAGQDLLEVRLTANDIVGATVTKIYTFHRGSYVVDVGYEIQNTGAAPMAATAYFQLVRDSSAPEGDSKFVPTYTGPAVYTDKEKFQKVDFSNIEKSKTDYPKTADNGWVGMLQHYFVSAWLPKDKTQREYYTKALGNDLFAAGVIVPVARLPAA